MPGFNLSAVFDTVAKAVPDQEVLVWRDRRLTYAEANDRIDGVAHFLVEQGLGTRTERPHLAGHESGQDHLGIYLRNGNEWIETLVGAWRARVAPYNVNYRYVEEELLYLLADAQTTALVYHAEFAPQVDALRDRLPGIRLLIQVADDSGNELLDGAVDYDAIIGTPPPAAGMPAPSSDDLFIIYTGGTTGMPKGVLWRHDDIFISAMGGLPFGGDQALRVVRGDRPGGPRRRRWAHLADAAAVHARCGPVVELPHDHRRREDRDPGRRGPPRSSRGARHRDPREVRQHPGCRRRRGQAAARRDRASRSGGGAYDLSGVAAFNNGGAPLTPGVRTRLLELAAARHAARRRGVVGDRHPDEPLLGEGRRGRHRHLQPPG